MEALPDTFCWTITEQTHAVEHERWRINSWNEGL